MSLLLLPGVDYDIAPQPSAAFGELMRLTGYDAIGVTRAGAPEWIDTRWGKALKSSSSNNYTFEHYTGAGDGSPRFGYVFTFSFVVLSNSGRDIFIRPHSQYSWHFENNSGTLRGYIAGAYRSLTTLTVGARYTVVLSYKAQSNDVRVFVNGSLIYSFSEYQQSSATGCIGSGYSGYGNGNTAILAASLQQGLWISDDEAAARSSDWSAYRESVPTYLWFDSAAGSAPSAPTLVTPTFVRVTSSGFGVSVGLT